MLAQVKGGMWSVKGVVAGEEVAMMMGEGCYSCGCVTMSGCGHWMWSCLGAASVGLGSQPIIHSRWAGL